MTRDRKPVLALSCLLGALALTLLAACGSTPDKQLPQNLNDAKQDNWVAIGDRIQVTDSYHPDVIRADVCIDIDGTVLLPEIGIVQVAGLTRSEIQDLLMKKYGPYYDRLDVKVEITTGGEKYFTVDEDTGFIRVVRADMGLPEGRIFKPSEVIETRGGKTR